MVGWQRLPDQVEHDTPARGEADPSRLAWLALRQREPGSG